MKFKELQERDKIGIIEQPIQFEDKIVGWHSQIHRIDGHPISGGTHQSRAVARRIAIAEYLERKIFRNLASRLDVKKEDHYMIGSYASTCGFACGFKKTHVKWRAICEGLERWAFSKWIDEGFVMNAISDGDAHKRDLSPMIRALASPFLAQWFYEIDIKVNRLDFGMESKAPLFFEGPNMLLRFRVFLGETEKGIFCGSRVVTSAAAWSHEIVEARRNYDNFKLSMTKTSKSDDSALLDRTIYFGENKAEAFRQIAAAKKTNWPTPELLLLKEVDTQIPGAYMWRCLFKNFQPWPEGPATRFVI